MENKIYIGDAVYIERTPLNEVVLTTENGDEVLNRVVMEPEVLENFENILKRWREDANGKG